MGAAAAARRFGCTWSWTTGERERSGSVSASWWRQRPPERASSSRALCPARAATPQISTRVVAHPRGARRPTPGSQPLKAVVEAIHAAYARAFRSPLAGAPLLSFMDEVGEWEPIHSSRAWREARRGVCDIRAVARVARRQRTQDDLERRPINAKARA